MAVLTVACRSPSEPVIRATGQVRGGMGCFTLVTSTRAYQPLTLPAEFQVDGLRVRFEARSKPTFNTCMAGETVELLSITRLP